MNKYEAAISNYEECRKRLSDLNAQRGALINSCKNERFPFDDGGEVDICLKVALSDLLETRRENPGEWYDYFEILQNNHYEGRCCQPCYDSYELKTGPVAEAKQSFGNAKRALSNLGKSIIKHNNHS